MNTWKTKDGKKIKIDKMDSEHLLNAYSMCCRKFRHHVRKVAFMPTSLSGDSREYLELLIKLDALETEIAKRRQERVDYELDLILNDVWGD